MKIKEEIELTNQAFALIDRAVKAGKLVWVPGTNKQQFEMLQDNGQPPIRMEVCEGGFRRITRISPTN